MNIPPLELQAFLLEYETLVFPGLKVLRADHFRHVEDGGFLTVFILEQDGKQLLAQEGGKILCQYHRIWPLFVAPAVKASVAVQDLLDQLEGLRSRYPAENYQKAREALLNLEQSSHPFAPFYLVQQDGMMGVVSPDGSTIVPAEYAKIEPFALVHPGDGGLFLCHRSGHHLNPVDVYDLNGNCIFRQISKLFPREETLSSPADGAEPVRKVKSLWVIRQTLDHPFPDDPDFQLVQEQPTWYSLKELRHPAALDLQLSPMEDRILWKHLPAEQLRSLDLLIGMADTIGHAIDCSSRKVLARLSDYRAFQRERTPLSVRLAKVTSDTPVDQLGFSVRTHHCLVRSGIQTAGELVTLSDDALLRLRRSTHEILCEIREVRSALVQLLS